MNSVELIRKLSSEGAAYFSDTLSWINPIPKNAYEIIEKIYAAQERLQYIQDRQGSTENDDTTKERRKLALLKTEIEEIIGKYHENVNQ
jgi:hypothetical protein